MAAIGNYYGTDFQIKEKYDKKMKAKKIIYKPRIIEENSNHMHEADKSDFYGITIFQEKQ